MLIDTHCHLDAAEFDSDRRDVIARFSEAGVVCVVVPAVSADNFSAVAALAHQHPAVRAGFGIHPLYVGAAKEE
ncbi:MAG: TatD-related deoxyribonuclease, partial [Pseudomonadota bacterium]